MDHASHHKRKTNTIWKNPLVIVCVLAVGYWLYTYHAEHALGFLPYAILLLCPIMHIFMHGEHGGHGGHGHSDSSEKRSKQEEN
jgi:hypothetical protein|tara:strand:+ start:11971 stop:12222 length:252 start_codon:yes stop_codon:yes gene_type:complete